MSEDRAVAGEHRAAESSLADEVMKDYSFIQMMADVTEVSIEELQQAYRRVCELIGSGLTPAAAISACHEEETRRIVADSASEGSVPA